MNKKKKTLKGFTLIELIIVLAIFSVIMVLVMSFIDPVSKLMSKTSVRERTAAYADNIGEYVDKSVRHAKFIRVFENGLCDTSNPDKSLSEEAAVQAFVDDYFDEAVNNKLQPVKGKVRVLKLVNTSEGSLESGRVYESVYDFTAGCGVFVKEFNIGGTPKKVKKWSNDSLYGESGDGIGPVNIGYANGDIKVDGSVVSFVTTPVVTTTDASGSTVATAAVTTMVAETFNHATAILDTSYTDKPVLNEEHFKEYSYYYKYDFQEFKPITDIEKYGISDKDKKDSKFYYSQLVPRTKNSVDMLLDSVSDIGLVINVVAYQNNAKGNNKIDTTYTVPGASSENVTIFKSPAYMDTVSMTFQNAIKQDKTLSFYRIDRMEDEKEHDGDPMTENVGKAKVVDDKITFKSGTGYSTAQSMHTIATGDAEKNDNIYIIYAVPSEIEDTEWDMEVNP